MVLVIDLVLKTLTIYTASKINLYLDVDTELLANNYHEIATIYQSVDLFDQINIEYTLDILDIKDTNTKQINIQSNNINLPLDHNNLVYKAIELFFEHIQYSGHYIFNIYINKSVPIAGGLAGGSSNAAGILYALYNNICPGYISHSQLLDIAQQLGADVPFCLIGGCMAGNNTGTQLQSINSNINRPIILIYPPDGEYLYAKDIYKQFDKISTGHNINTNKYQEFIRYLKDGKDNLFLNNIYNALEPACCALSPWVSETLNILRTNNLKTLVSGSGPSIVIFPDRSQDIQTLSDKLYSNYNLCNSIHYFTDRHVYC